MKIDAAKAAGKPTKALEDRIYEIEASQPRRKSSPATDPAGAQ
jgi:hypothetical protein